MRQRMYRVLIACLFGLVAVAKAANDTDSENSWRCGIFFAGARGAKPRAKVFVLPKKFPADCSKARPDIFSRTCFEVMERGMNEWNFISPSRIRPESGKTIGDDLCSPIPKDVRSPGLQLGFYMAYCGNEWADTGLRTPNNLCCFNRTSIAC